MVTAALDGFGWPAFVLAQSGAVLLHNTQAQRLMAARQVCRLSAGKLLLTRADAQQALNEALHRACAERGARMAVLPVGPADGVRAWNLRVVPMPRGIAAQPCALAYAGPARPPAPPVKLLQQAYGLSESQAEVAFMLADGLTPKEIAFARNVATATVRTQMRAIFTKTGVRRQGELAPVMFGLPRVLADGDGRG